MPKGIIGKKLGMTQYFKDDGKVVPVTVVEAGPCVVAQVKTTEKDGYDAIQLGFGKTKASKMNKPLKGHFASKNIEKKRYLREFRNYSLDVSEGDEVTVADFSDGETVNVTGISKGKGFAGSVKRWNQSTGPNTHGSHFHRSPGSVGAVDARRVFKGHKMPGRMGHDQVTVQNLEIVKVDAERSLLLIKGSLPGPNKTILEIKTVDR